MRQILNDVPEDERKAAEHHARFFANKHGNLPEQLIQMLIEMIALNEYVDNVRVARINDPESVRRYDEAFERGCCGSIDREIIINSVTYKYGCNFGH